MAAAPQLVLGFESSCDETGVALCTTEGTILGQALHSQIAMHKDYGGVVPELASRDHIRRLIPLMNQVLAQSGKTLQDVDAIAVTTGPGLPGALMAGTAFATSLAMGLGKPVIPVHHLEGHLLSPLLSATSPEFPFTALLVSGGHSQLMAVQTLGQYTLLGETLDDAAGEAFDKTAKMIGLPYPGGPALSALAERGDPTRFKLPRPMLHSGDFNFSFSGLKTAVLTTAMKLAGVAQPSETMVLNPQDKADLCASFQAAIVDVLVKKSIAATRESQHQRLVVAGGVGANRLLRTQLTEAASKRGIQVYFPELSLCTDNGAMIAFAAALRLKANPKLLNRQDYSMQTRPRCPLNTAL
ncbi:tRNA (adenosine(37)-N6)-threonylcarbamoyltransferase complex transferase subunit TsaD [Limnobacter humi]|uniref:tRNA N6-adenosine threonylcarbamoyltransferase n=1 Tax=Limnobacter humi TaxID=1778671 RepID=A0ABT1WHK1_9BURK|nr:tRNA (adenosine(37)-N6)-threonylcarbamoyltransferase complex transferase subunit TsaD [Limnobacter humi]MCQ8896975.1 tRNA (adenosine(37)-N6)-threonylcarbamoyltransferase complex transferase subunit TsaD [Limnobacter humi]